MPAPAQALLLQQLSGRLTTTQPEQKLPRAGRTKPQITQDPLSFKDALRRDINASPRKEQGTPRDSERSGDRVREISRDTRTDKHGGAEPRRAEGRREAAQDRPEAAHKPRDSAAVDQPIEPRDADVAEAADSSAEEFAVADSDPTAPAHADSAPTADDPGAAASSDEAIQPDAEQDDPSAPSLALKLPAAATSQTAAQPEAAETAAAEEGAARAQVNKPRTTLLKRLASQAQVRAGVIPGQTSMPTLGASIAPSPQAEASAAHETGDDPPQGQISPQYAEFATPAAAEQAARRAQSQHRATGGASSTSHTDETAAAVTSSPAADAHVSQDATRPAPKSPDSVFLLERTGTIGKAGSPTLAGPARSTSAGGSTADADAPAAVARGLSAAVLQKGGSLTLKLTPESLGQVRIDMTLDRGSVAVRLEASSAAAHDLLESSMAALRSTLEAKGLSVDRLTVHIAPGAAHTAAAAPAPSNAQNQPDAQQQQSNTQDQTSHHDAGQGASKGRDQQDPDQLWLFDDKSKDTNETRTDTFRLKLSAVA